MGHWGKFSRARMVLAALSAATLLACGSARASYLDDDAAFGQAVSILRSALGNHPRVLRIEVEGDGITIEAQDPQNPNHVDLWRYGTVTYLQMFSVKRVTGPQPLNLQQLINPDLEANLFDLDAVDLSAAARLREAAIARARLQDAASVTHMEIARQIFLLPKPASGDIRWSVRVGSGRESAEIHANARGVIVGVDLSQTQRARTLNILRESPLVAEAAAAFRQDVGAGPVLTSVTVEARTIGFSTNIRDQTLQQLGMGLPATASYTWDLNGLQRRLGRVDVSAQMNTPGATPFSVDDVDWTIVAKLIPGALARAAVAGASVTRLTARKSSEQPGAPAFVWTVDVTDSNGEVTSVIADTAGVVRRVILPANKRPKVNWLDAATVANSIAQVAPAFGRDAKIASLVFDDRGGRITVDDPANGGRAATFEFAPDGLTRASISFSLDSMGPRFGIADLAALDERRIAVLEAEAFKRLGTGGAIYLESITVGAHPFVRQAGARAIEVRVRDLAEDSVRAHYGWIVFDFDGKMLDLSTL